TIENGTVQGFQHEGINGDSTKFWVIKDMRIVFNREAGLVCGQSCLVEDSIVANNGGSGVLMDDGLVLGNVISRNQSAGLGSGTAGYANNTFVLNDGGIDNGHIAGNATKAHPNTCQFASGIKDDC